MPFALVIIGLIMIVSGSRDTYKQLGAELQSDFTGEGNFLYWLVAIGGVGMLGYVKELRGFSRAFMALILIAMVIRNGGVFDQFTAAIGAGPIEAKADKDTNGITPQSAAQSVANTGNSVIDRLNTYRQNVDSSGGDLAFGFKSGDAFGNAQKVLQYALQIFA